MYENEERMLRKDLGVEDVEDGDQESEKSRLYR